MGSPPQEVDRSDNETQHEATLTRGYWLAGSACTLGCVDIQAAQMIAVHRQMNDAKRDASLP